MTRPDPDPLTLPEVAGPALDELLAIEAEARAALIDELVAAVEGLWPLGSGIEAQAAFDCRAAVLHLLEGARHGK